MKHKMKYLIISLLVAFLLPISTKAETLNLKKVKSDKNTVAYDVIYIKGEEDTTPIETYILKMYKENEDLDYSITSSYAESIDQCNINNCAMRFIGDPISEVGKEYTIATVTITNNTSTDKETSIKIDGFDDSKKVFTVSALTSVTTTTTTTQAIVPPNSNLSNLTISAGIMDQAFNKDITTYNITEIKDTVPTAKIIPTCETECDWNITCPLGECSVKNPTDQATVQLQTGANKISIVVTSKDKSMNKTYILNIYRGEIETSSAYLSDIKITGATLSPNFDSMTNDYTTTVGLDVEKLDIITTPEDPSASIQIKGNENLKEGENTITITVTSSDNENKQVYTIIVTKEEIEEEKIDEEKKEVTTTKVEKKKNNLWLIIILIISVIGAITTTAILLFRKRKKNNKNNDKNNKNGGTKVTTDKASASDLFEENSIEKENTESLNILDETRRQMKDEPKQDIDEALDDLMQTKRLELGDLNF